MDLHANPVPRKEKGYPNERNGARHSSNEYLAYPGNVGTGKETGKVAMEELCWGTPAQVGDGD